jgi:aminomethyltransferase
MPNPYFTGVDRQHMSGRRSPLRDHHDAVEATFTEFGGWEMPVEFASIRREHTAVRDAAGRFDVSHMGELEIVGPDASALVQRLTTNDVSSLDPGRAQYAGITDADGNLIDDTIVYNLPEDWDEGYMVVPNAGNDQSVLEWFRDHREEWKLDATIENRTEEYALIAIQGPEAVGLVDEQSTSDVTDVGRFGVAVASIAGVECLVSRTGYTGEDGFELLCSAADAATVWRAFECQRCGLGARDTLRIEMGFLLSGQDFDRESDPRTPYEAGIGFVVDLETTFVGRDALAAQRDAGVEERFVGLRLLERGVPRHGYDIVDGEETVGTVTSGTMSPTLGEPIALGYLPAAYVDAGTDLGITIRGESKAATVTEPPFLEGY